MGHYVLWNSAHVCVRYVVCGGVGGRLTSLVHGSNTDGYFDLAHLFNCKQTTFNAFDKNSQSGPPTKTWL